MEAGPTLNFSEKRPITKNNGVMKLNKRAAMDLRSCSHA